MADRSPDDSGTWSTMCHSEANAHLKSFLKAAPFTLCGSGALAALAPPSPVQIVRSGLPPPIETDNRVKQSVKNAARQFVGLAGHLADTLKVASSMQHTLQQLLGRPAHQLFRQQRSVQQLVAALHEHLAAASCLHAQWNAFLSSVKEVRSGVQSDVERIAEVERVVEEGKNRCEEATGQAALLGLGGVTAALTGARFESGAGVCVGLLFLGLAAWKGFDVVEKGEVMSHHAKIVAKARVSLIQAQAELQLRTLPAVDQLIGLTGAMCRLSECMVRDVKWILTAVAGGAPGYQQQAVSFAEVVVGALDGYITICQGNSKVAADGGLVVKQAEITALKVY